MNLYEIVTAALVSEIRDTREIAEPVTDRYRIASSTATALEEKLLAEIPESLQALFQHAGNSAQEE